MDAGGALGFGNGRPAFATAAAACATWVLMLSATVVQATVPSSASPIAPPTCWAVLSRLEATPESAANGVSNTVTHLVYSHHHADHAGASSLFEGDVIRIGHEETRRLLLRDDDPARPAPEVTFADRCTLDIAGERAELAWHGPNHSPDNIYIHFPATTP